MSRPYALLLLLTGQALAAQGSRDSAALANPVMAAARPQYEQVKDYLLRAADAMPEQKYAFRPTPQGRTFEYDSWGAPLAPPSYSTRHQPTAPS